MTKYYFITKTRIVKSTNFIFSFFVFSFFRDVVLKIFFVLEPKTGLTTGNRRIDMNLIAILKDVSGIYNFATYQHRVFLGLKSQNDSQNFMHRDR